MIDLSESGKGYAHLEGNIEVDPKGLISIKDSVVKEYCSRCGNSKLCETRVKKYNNRVYFTLWKEMKEKSVKDEKERAERMKVEFAQKKAESLKRLSEIQKIDIPEVKEKSMSLEEWLDLMGRTEIEYKIIEKNKIQAVTRKLVRYIVVNNLNTTEAQQVYDVVMKYSVVKPKYLNMSYFTNAEGVEERILEQLKEGGIPSLTISKKELKKLQEDREARRKPVNMSEASKQRKELVERIKLGEAGVLEI
jgi:hypothetical protein